MAVIEDIIRDKLATNLHLIDPNYKLVKTEYSLPKGQSTRGFIDILARDKNNNYIIIEVKRSNQSARQAIHEILKYHDSLIRKLKLRHGEVRLAIISTEWKELLLPFSAFVNETELSIDGYNLSVDKDFDITDIKRINPCKTPDGRMFATTHGFYLYKDEKQLRKGIKSHLNVYPQKRLNDFVLVILKAPEIDIESYREMINQRVEFISGKPLEPRELGDKLFSDFQSHKYAIYSAFQRLSFQEYHDILSYDKIQFRETTEYLSDLDNDEDKLKHVEDIVLGVMKPTFYCDSVEVSYPAKFAKLLDEGNWEISEIIRSNSLKANLLLTEETIISEMKGIEGGYENLLHEFCETSHRSKFMELKNNIASTLEDNPAWRNHILNFLESIDTNTSHEVEVYIYSPCHILLSIFKMIEEDIARWLPQYKVSVKSQDSEITYVGAFHWRKKKVNFSKMVEQYFDGDAAVVYPLMWGGNDDNNSEVMSYLGLSYESYKIKNEKGKDVLYVYDHYNFIKVRNIKNGLADFMENSNGFIEALITTYTKHYSNGVFVCGPWL